MGVGDFITQESIPKVGTQPKTGGVAGAGVFGSGIGAGMGGNIGGSVQPMQPATTNGGYASNGAWSEGPTVDRSGANPFTDFITQEYTRVQGGNNAAPRDWYDTVGGSERMSSSPAPVATPVTADPEGMLGQFGSQFDPRMLDLLGITGQYQYGVDYANQDHNLNQQQLEMKRRLLGLDAADVGIDKNSIANRKAGTQRDSEFLRQMRGLYGDGYANQLAGIQTKQDINLLDHENQYVSGGAWFAPGQVYRKDRINASADQDRESARIGLEQNQIGVDRSLSNNDTQMAEYDFDIAKLDNKLAANGINLQQLGINGQQLTLALNKRINDLGLSQFMDATALLNSATSANTEQSAAAMQFLLEWLQGGGQGPIPQPGYGV